jgi:hypothetical protein
MRLSHEFSVFDWTIGASVSPGSLMVGVAWETAPLSFYLTLPFLRFWIERRESDRDEAWPWGWSLFRLTVWKTECRLDLDLHIWQFGLCVIEPADFGLYTGPFNIQIETNKGYATGFPPGVPTLRLFFPPDRSVQPWPPRCDCDPSGDNVDGI